MKAHDLLANLGLPARYLSELTTRRSAFLTAHGTGAEIPGVEGLRRWSDE
jgi:hypothetical protein